MCGVVWVCGVCVGGVCVCGVCVCGVGMCVDLCVCEVVLAWACVWCLWCCVCCLVCRPPSGVFVFTCAHCPHVNCVAIIVSIGDAKVYKTCRAWIWFIVP